MALYQLVYRSKPAVPFSDGDLIVLLEAARSFNAAHNISGILLYGYNTFIQLIEGDDDVIRGLYYQHIYHDIRHHSLKVLQETYIEKRRFERWSMAFRPLDKERLRFLNGFIDPDIPSEYGRNLLSPLQITEAMETLAHDLDKRGPEAD